MGSKMTTFLVDAYNRYLAQTSIPLPDDSTVTTAGKFMKLINYRQDRKEINCNEDLIENSRKIIETLSDLELVIVCARI